MLSSDLNVDKVSVPVADCSKFLLAGREMVGRPWYGGESTVQRELKSTMNVSVVNVIAELSETQTS